MDKILIKNVLVLFTGSIVGQSIPIAIIPILTRIYTPEDFGLLALYAAIVGVLGVISTGRYEMAIMLPKNDEDARVILQLSALVAVLVSFIVSIPILLWNTQLAQYIGNDEIAAWLYLVPVSVCLTGIYQALSCWNNRYKNYRNIALSSINQSLFQGLTQTTLGLLETTGGLIWGHFFGIGSKLIYLFKKDECYKNVIKKITISATVDQIIKYKKFPKYSVFGAICDAAAQQMPILMLTKFYSDSVTGMFSLTFRILNIPTSIISSAIGQVLFQKVIDVSQTKPRSLSLYIIKLFIILFLIYLPLIPILFMWGESIFSAIFGGEWSDAGKYAGYLVIAVAVRFAVSPLSVVLSLERNIKIGVYWQVLYLCTIVPTLAFFSYMPVKNFIIAFVVHEVVLYLMYLVLIIKGSKAVVHCEF